MSLESLPLRHRTKNAVLRRRQEPDWLAVATVDDLMRLPNFGITSLLDLLTVVEAASVHADRQRLVGAPTIARNNLRGADGLEVVAAWATGEHQAVTLLDLLDLALELRPPEVEEAWNTLWSQPLALFATEGPHDYSLAEKLRELLGSFDEREDLILRDRILARAGRLSTLDELGSRLGVTRERVRQIEQRVVKSLLKSAHGAVGRRSTSLAARLGAAVPLGSTPFEDSLRWVIRDVDVSMAALGADVLLYLAGPYKEDDGWLIRSPDQGRLTAARSDLLSSVDEGDVLAPADVTKVLTSAGILEPLHERWIDHLDLFRRTQHGLLRWDGSTLDKLYRLLRLRGQPATTEELLSELGETLNPRGIRARLMEDSRFVRINLRGEFALPEWGHDEYTGIADEITEELDRRGGSVSVSALIALLVDQYGVSESSVRTYAQAPRFVVEEGMVRLRRADEPYEVSCSIAETRGCYQLSPSQLSWLVTVDTDILRGSGRALPTAVAAFLNVRPGGQLRLRLDHSPDGATTPIAWNLTSTAGPAIGSLRSLALGAGAGHGSLLKVVFDSDVGTIGGTLVETRHFDVLDPCQQIAELTGLSVGEGDPVEVMARALRVPQVAVRRTLRSRGDGQVADCLPEVEVPGDLGAAIADLGEVL